MNNKKIVLLIFVAAFIIRGAIAVYSYNPGQIDSLSDDKAYFNYAENILQQGIFPTDLSTFDPSAKVVGPGMAWILAAAIGVFGKNWLVIFFLSSLVSAILCVVIYYLGRFLFSEKIGLFAAFWAIFYVLYLKFIPTAGKDLWMSLFFLLSVYFVIKESVKLSSALANWRNLLFLVLSVTFLIHIDERYFAYFPLFVIAMILLNPDKKYGFSRSVIVTGAVILLMIPWTIRNYQVFDRIVILSERTAVFTDPIFGYEVQEEKEQDESPELKNRWYLTEAQIDSVLQGELTTFPATGKKIKKGQVKAMRDGIVPHRFSALEGFASVFTILWKPVDFNRGYSTTGYRWDGKWSLAHNASVALTYGVVLLFGFVGIFLLYRHRKSLALLLLAIFAWHSLIHMLTIPFTRNRYRMPVDGLIIVLGIAGLYYLLVIIYNKYLKKEKKLEPSPFENNLVHHK